MKGFFVFLIFAFCSPLAYAGESSGTVSCNSTSAPVQIVAALGGSTVVNVPYNAATGIYVTKDNSSGCANTTAGAGYPIGQGNAIDFLSREDGYTGQLCCLLWTGSSAVTAGYNKR